MKIDSIHKHGMFCQKVRAAATQFEILQAAKEYMEYMDEVENDMFQSYERERVHHLGKTAD